MENQILFAQNTEKHECFIKLIGKISYSNNTGFDAFIDKYIRTDNPPSVLLDLSECNYLDSTNLGLLGGIAEVMFRRKLDKPVIISTNPSVTEIIDTMGFRVFFIIIENKSNIDQELTNIPQIAESEKDKALSILKAHETLMNMNDKNKATFKSVVDILKSQVKKD